MSYKKFKMVALFRSILLITCYLSSGCGKEFRLKIPDFESASQHDAAQRIEAEHTGKLSSVGSGEVSELGTAAARAMRDKVERNLVKEAGEAAVMLQLARNQYADLKERLVRLKTLISTYKREISSADVGAKSAEINGQVEMAAMHRQKGEVRKRMLAFLAEREPEAEASLKAFYLEYEKLKIQIDMLSDEVAVYQSSAGILDNNTPESPLRVRLDNIEGLRRSLQQQADRAKSLFDVANIEQKFSK